HDQSAARGAGRPWFGDQRPGERAAGPKARVARFGSHASSSSADGRMPARHPSVRILGVDDWAWKKGQTYGTILVDLEKRCPIELLADRKEDTLTAWLLAHPEIEVISRDRGGEYAAAAKKGAPQAKQIADKFHIVKNLRDGLKELMARKQKVLPEVEEASSDGVPRLTQGKQQASALSEAPQSQEPEKYWRSMSKEPRRSSAGARSPSAA